jgi:glycogen phosphorylase
MTGSAATKRDDLCNDLLALSHDLWWTGQPDASDLWMDLDPDLWEQLNHNPVPMLRELGIEHASAEWLERASQLLGRWRVAQAAPPMAGSPSVAYFCMEFGLHECLPIYSGGLGILSGDHLRSAADLGVDLVAVGLFYNQGYFKQLMHDGRQVAAYATNRSDRLPVRPVLDAEGEPLMVEVPHGHHTYLARAFEVRIGRVRLFLLDSDMDQNPVGHRHLTQQLYGGDEHTRCAQEVLLGIGGVRLLRAMGMEPQVFHLNEGHSAFLCLELWAEHLKRGVPRDEAWEQVRAQCVFTTHTPVPAGHDRFAWPVINAALGGYRESLGLPQGSFMNKGRVDEGDIHEPLCMTVVALKGARQANGVSALHGVVSRKMWATLDPKTTAPIGHITNGVHPTAWLAPETVSLFDRHLPGWREHLEDVAFWEAATRIPSADLLAMARSRRERLVMEVRRRLGRIVLETDALTIGFARRFAPYKRANLLLADAERLRALLDSGAQVVYAGKAHPADLHGQALIAEVQRWSLDPRFRRRLVFVPNYDAALGRLLTQGSDVWLNTPRRPREASGTSGQKAAINGNPNLSILDGWWPEAWDDTNGWAIGGDQEWAQVEEQDEFDANDLYRVLETQVLPSFQDGESWARRMGRSIATCMPVFNTHRMVRDYVEQLYRDRPAEPAAVR